MIQFIWNKNFYHQWKTHRGEGSGVALEPRRAEFFNDILELYSTGLSGGVCGMVVFLRWNRGEPRKLIRRLLSRARQWVGDNGEAATETEVLEAEPLLLTVVDEVLDDSLDWISDPFAFAFSFELPFEADFWKSIL